METLSYTPAQWDLVLRTMDEVDRRRHGDAPANLPAVRDLVRRTYASQGVAVDDGILDHALAVAARSWTPPAPRAGGRTGVGQATSAPREPAPVREARDALAQVTHHTPFSDHELSQALTRSRRVVRAVGSTLAVVSAGGWLWLWGAPSMSLTAAVVLPLLNIFLAIAGLRCLQANDSLTVAQDALERGDYDHPCLRHGLHAWKGELGFSSPAPLAATSARWQAATAAANSDALLLRTWARWLRADRPLRECDVELLCNASDALKTVRAWEQRQDTQHAVAQQADARSHAWRQLRPLDPPPPTD